MSSKLYSHSALHPSTPPSTRLSATTDHHLSFRIDSSSSSSPSTSTQHPHNQDAAAVVVAGHSSPALYSGHTASSSFAAVAPSSSSATSAFPDVFADEYNERRRDSLALPRLESTTTEIVVSAASSPPSSPYVSPRLPPKQRQGGMASMGEITLPPLSSAVPMRRGAVSGASSGPSLPFPPIRLPPSEDDIPSRGPSPTLGKRASFSLGHSNHVPPGPAMQLPTPALSGSAERRGGVGGAQQQSGYGGSSSSSSFHGEEYSRTGAIRMSDDGSGYHYANGGGNPNVPRSVGAPAWSPYAKAQRSDMDDGSGQMYNYSNASVATSMQRPDSHFTDEPYYAGGGHPHGGQPHGGMHSSRYGPPHSAYGMPPRHMGYGLSMGPDDHLMPINGKRPRSAPRVLSSQPRIFACSQCPARFARNHDLKRHQRGHLSVRPYPCTWCGKSFSRKDALKRHVLVKGCGKDKNGGGTDGAGRRSGTDEFSGSRSHQDEEDSHQDDDQSAEEDDSQTGGSQNGSFHHHHHHQQQQHQHHGVGAGEGLSYTSAYRPSTHQASDASSSGMGLYRWGKPNTMPTLPMHAAAAMRVEEMSHPANTFAGFTAGRRPSASAA